jgi:hypothetical protein
VKRNRCLPPRRREQTGLQVSPADEAIGLAVTLARGLSKRNGRQPPAISRVADLDRVRLEEMAGEIVEYIEAAQHRHGVGRKLDAGPDLLKAGCAFEDIHGEAVAGECDGRD